MDILGLEKLPSHAQDDLGMYFPELDLNRVEIHIGLPWYVPDTKTAFTRSLDIYIKEGKYDPCSIKGLALIAHELVHVRQQGEGFWSRARFDNRYMTDFKKIWSSKKPEWDSKARKILYERRYTMREAYRRIPAEVDAYNIQHIIEDDLREMYGDQELCGCS